MTAQDAAAKIQQEAERAATIALNNARQEISRLQAEAGTELPDDVRDPASTATHSALLRHRATPNPAGAKKQTSPSDAERTDDPPVAQTEA